MTHTPRLRLGTRASPLARWQADWVATALADCGAQVALVPITTRGDAEPRRSVRAMPTRGVFTKAIQAALLDGTIDLAVHSLKDLPTEPVEGLQLAAVSLRESPHDVLVSNRYDSLASLPAGAAIGTGSLRRQALLLHARPDLKVADIRGNVDTRLRHLDEGRFDAIVLAEAGLNRLGLAHRIRQVLEPPLALPAVGQGALGIETRADDPLAGETVAQLDDGPSRAAVLAERALLSRLQGGCLAPVGSWCRTEDGRLQLQAVVLSPDGGQRLFAEASGSLGDPRELGKRVADELLRQGAADLIGASR